MYSIDCDFGKIIYSDNLKTISEDFVKLNNNEANDVKAFVDKVIQFKVDDVDPLNKQMNDWLKNIDKNIITQGIRW